MLRPYQQRGSKDLRAEFAKGNKRVLFVSPTGSGKTVQAVWVMDQALQNGKRVLFVCDRDILISQTIEAIGYNNIDHGVIKAGYDEDRSQPMQIASIQSLLNRDLPPADLIVIDEAHEWLSQQMWLVDQYDDPFVIGLTATPFRADGRSFASVYDELVVNTTPRELIDLGYLVPEKVYAPARINVSGVSVSQSSGDYVQKELAQAVSEMKIIGRVVDSWEKFAKGELTMAFCVNVNHAKMVTKAFQDAGIPAELVTGEVTPKDRKRIIAKYKKKEILVLVNVEVYVKGANIPEIRCVIDLAPTLSLARYIQKIGRAGRPAPGKDHFIQLDQAGNSLRHGFWSQDREYSLGEDSGKGIGEYVASTKMCPSCFYVMLSTASKCELCDYIFVTADNTPSQVDGELEEIIIEQVKVAYKDGHIHYKSISLGAGNFAVDASKSYWTGTHMVKREKSRYNLYGKRTENDTPAEALQWLMETKTGSSARRFLIEKILEANKKGYANQWPFLQYKKRYRHFPKMG